MAVRQPSTTMSSPSVQRSPGSGVERQRWMQTLLKFERSLVGCETDQAQSQRIWQSVVFYNYLQVAMGGPREAGTAAQYQAAAAVGAALVAVVALAKHHDALAKQSSASV